MKNWCGTWYGLFWGLSLCFSLEGTAHSLRNPITEIQICDMKCFEYALSKYYVDHGSFPPPVLTPPYGLTSLTTPTAYLSQLKTDYFAHRQPYSIKKILQKKKGTLIYLSGLLLLIAGSLWVFYTLSERKKIQSGVKLLVVFACMIFWLTHVRNSICFDINFSPGWLEITCGDRPANLESSFFYGLTSDGYALVASLGSDYLPSYEWEKISEHTSSEILLNAPRYDASNGLVSGGDIWVMVRPPLRMSSL